MARIGIMWRQLAYYYLIIIVTVSVLALLVAEKTERYYLRGIEEDLRIRAELIEEVLVGYLPGGHIEDIDQIAKKLGRKIGTRITVIAPDGVVLGDSEEDPERMENHATRPEIKRALEGQVGKSIRYSTTLKQRMMYVAIPVEKSGRIVGVIRTSLPLEEIEGLIGTMNRNIGHFTVLLLTFALVLACLSSKLLSRPIKDMVDTTKKIASGDFGVRVFAKRKDELGELAAALNEMARKLEDSFASLSTERQELRAILSSTVEGIVVLEEGGRIILANESFKRMFGLPPSIGGKFYWEILRNPDFKTFVEDISRKGKVEAKEVGFQDKVYLANGVLLEDGRKVAVFHDITEFKKLERIKADFVANVSHELRTPLTAIKGFVETLEEEATPVQQHFLQIIRRHSDRLINLVNDLLILSKLEDRELKLEIQEVNLKDLVSDVLRMFEGRIKEKNLTAELFAEEDNAVIHGDPFLLEQLFINLIDNAIKYNVENGRIELRLSPIDGHMKIEVSDTGIGIAREHLDRIFERFYVVDKGRSRELGGTGLGLSIVKHIVLAHNGRIDVQSEPGRGTTFTVVLPK
ncbi:MAG TPA: HAMP domain-containing protein [Firmicutes bacterium]|nr:HAMP domain-containing protein [Bacillota bacterium]